MEIAERVHHFTNYKFNWYIVEDQGRLTVLDTGFPGHYPTFRRSLASLGRSLDDIDAIIITHAHADHTGMAPRLQMQSSAPVYVHRDDVRYVRRPLYLPWSGLLTNAWRPYTASMLTHAVVHGLLRLTRIGSPTPIVDGQQLDAPGRPHIIHIPGHTRGDVVVHLPDRGVLFTGDALVTRNLLTGRDGAPQITSPPLNTEARQAAAALSRLRTLGHTRMLPGHGKPWEGDMNEAVDLALAGTRP